MRRALVDEESVFIPSEAKWVVDGRLISARRLTDIMTVWVV